MGRRKKIKSKVEITNPNIENFANVPNNADAPKQTNRKSAGDDCTEQHITTKREVPNSMLNFIKQCEIDKTKIKEISEEAIEVKNKPNAFQLLMDNRNKSIGQNLEGITLVESITTIDLSDSFETEKGRKMARKEKFNEWAQRKVSVKRKLQEEEEEARDEFINETMVKRSRRLKKMLNINFVESIVVDDDDMDFDYEPKGKSGKKRKKNKKERQKPKLVSPKYDIKEVNINPDKNSNAKLAPIFTKTKQETDPKVLEAKKSFLKSDLPSSLKKKFERTSSFRKDDACTFFDFPVTCHVQQRDENNLWNLTQPKLAIKSIESTDYFINAITNKTSRLINLIDIQERQIKRCEKEFSSINNLPSVMNRIKMENPHYPVFRVFKSLCEISNYAHKKKKRKSNGAIPKESCIMWTEKYKLKSANHFIGNLSNALELKKWLSNWMQKSEKPTTESDFESDGDSSLNNLVNGIILVGPHGSGKTASVYAIATELGYNVIELNASGKRTGKKLLQELLEATQSHQLHKRNTKSLFPKENAKCSDRKLGLLLVDDVDIIFEQDEGFICALTQLLQTTKRPIILTATDLSMPHLQRFLNQYPKLSYKSLTVYKQAVWLKILSAMEGVLVDLPSLEELLEWHKGDIRKTLLYLQFWLLSGGNFIDKDFITVDKTTDADIVLVDDDDPILDVKNSKQNSLQNRRHHGDCMKTFLPIANLIMLPIDLDNYYLNMCNVIFKTHDCNKDDVVKSYAICTKNLSFSNLFSKYDMNRIVNEKVIFDSLELSECMEYYNETCSISEEIAQYIMESTLEKFVDRKTFNWSFKRPKEKRMDYEEQIKECLPLAVSLDYENFYMDYSTAFRIIAKSEENRSRNNFKRCNRFYNYLNNLGMRCNSSLMESLSNSLAYDCELVNL